MEFGATTDALPPLTPESGQAVGPILPNRHIVELTFLIPFDLPDLTPMTPRASPSGSAGPLEHERRAARVKTADSALGWTRAAGSLHDQVDAGQPLLGDLRGASRAAGGADALSFLPR